MGRFTCFYAAALLAVPEASSSAEEFTVRSKVISPPETGTLTCYEIALGSRQFLFVPPINWRAETDIAGRILRFRRVTRQAVLEVTLAPPSDTEPDPEAVARQPAGGHDTMVIERFAPMTGVGAGKGANIAWTAAGVAMRSRAVVAPLSLGNVYFVLVCPAEDFEACQRVLDGVMTSFQATSPTDGGK